MRQVTACHAGLLILALSSCDAGRDVSGRDSSQSRRASATPSPSLTATALDSALGSGEAMYFRGEFDSVRTLLRDVVAHARERQNSSVEARALTWLGLAAYRQGDYGESRVFQEAALEIKQTAGLRAELWRSYNALGLLTREEGRFEEALEFYEQAAQAAVASENATARAGVENNRALVYTAQGRFTEARAALQSARAEYRRVGDAMREGRALSNLASLDVQLGNPRAAATALEQALALLRRAEDPTGEQNALGQLGTAYDALGEPGLALAVLDSALRLSRVQGLKQEEASNLELIAGIHRQGGDYQRALTLYEQANRIDSALGLTVERAANLRSVAEIYGALGMSDLAREKGRHALELHRESGARLNELRDLLFLAELTSAARGSRAEIERHLRSADALSDELSARVARVEVALAKGTILDRAADARGVLSVLRRARGDIAHGGFGGEWQAATLRARAFARLLQFDSAAVAGREAVAAVERVRGNFGSGLLRSSFVSDKAATYSDLVEVLLRLKRIPEAFEIADAARSHAFLEHLTAVGSDLPSGATARELSDGEAMLRRITTLAAQLDTLEERSAAKRNASTEMQLRKLAADLAQARSAYETHLAHATDRDTAGAALLGGGRVSAASIQRALNGDEAILEYLVTPHQLVVFVVTRHTVRSLVRPVSRDDLARRVRLARDLLGSRPASEEQRGVLLGLHDILIQPLERAGLLRGVRRLIVVPQSVLTYLPFAALRQSETGRYVLEDYSILLIPSAAALGVLRAHSPAETPGPSGVAAFAPFPGRLPGSARETRALARAVSHTTTHSGSRATELAVRTALTDAGVVHIATHGIMNPRNPMFSRLELRTGTGRSNDDGRLEVHELLGLRIAAPFVFLSGCETGVGASWSTQFAQGTDYATLAQAMLYAGARNVAATLWRIGDEGAAVFAERFYVNLRTLPPAEALAAAQRELLRDSRYNDPFFWAAYQVIGHGGSLRLPHR